MEYKLKAQIKITIVALCAALSMATPSMAQSDTVGFRDVPREHWSWYAVNQIAQAGLVEGDPNDRFRGNDPMTRYEFAVAMSRLLPSSPHDPLAHHLMHIDSQLRALDSRLKALEEKINTSQPTSAASEGLSSLRNDLKTAVTSATEVLATAEVRSD